jgi:uncharacterized membrane protein SirB2
MRFMVFLFILCLQILVTVPRFQDSCESHASVKTMFLYITHHVLDVFLFWSFLFLTTKLEFAIHLCILIVVVAHWATHKNTCILTVWMNHFCGYPEEKWLDSLKNRLGLHHLTEYFHFVWMFLLAFQDGLALGIEN